MPILNTQDNGLTIHVTGLKNNKGQVIIDIFNNENGYPMKTGNAILRKKLTIPEDGKVVFYIEGLENGEYAFALIHDETDMNFLNQKILSR